MAGFEVIIYGRFWVITEAMEVVSKALGHESIKTTEKHYVAG
jgi:hypothetical protein